MVTHNEMFLHALAERLVVFDGDDIFVHEGGYQRFLDKVGWLEEQGGPFDGPRRKSPGRGKPARTPRELRRLRSEIVAEKSRDLRPLETRMAEIEAAVEDHDRKLEEMNRDLSAASRAQQGSRVVELSRAMHLAKQAVDGYLEELERLTVEVEDKKASYDKRLRELDEESGADA